AGPHEVSHQWLVDLPVVRDLEEVLAHDVAVALQPLAEVLDDLLAPGSEREVILERGDAEDVLAVPVDLRHVPRQLHLELRELSTNQLDDRTERLTLRGRKRGEVLIDGVEPGHAQRSPASP